MDASPSAVETPHGPAHVHLTEAESPRALLLLGHGAGGGVGAPDLQAAREGALAAGVSVGLVEQPYRVAGRKSPAPAKQLDAAWEAVAEAVGGTLPLVAGGRSSGARVACRTAAATGAAGVVCLAFPFQPPARKGKDPKPSRLGELDAVEVPVLIVQGESDQFGMPPEGPGRELVRQPGTHGLKGDLPGVENTVHRWLLELPSI